MKNFVLALGVLAAVAMYVGCEFGVEPAPVTSQAEPARESRGGLAHGQLQFVTGYRQGQAESARQGKPMMLYFTAQWCAYCRQMADEAFVSPQVISLSNHFVCVLIDADAEPEVCRQFQITGYPTIQFLSPRGVPLERVVGKQPGHQLVLAMQSALQHVARRGTSSELQ